MFFGAVLPVSLFSLVFLVLLSLFLPEKINHFHIKCLFGITLAMYLQGTFINIDYGTGVLDGTAIQWQDYTVYAILDSLAWIVCLGLPFFIDYILKNKSVSFHFVINCLSLCLVAMQLPALISQLIAYQPEENREFRITSEKIFGLSPQQNILIFILDTMDESLYQEYADSHPSFTEELDGFTHYSNASAAGAWTTIALPAMFTGTPFTRTSTYSEYLDRVWSQPNAFSVLHDGGYQVYVYGETTEFSSVSADYIDNFDLERDSVGSYFTLAKKIYKLTLFNQMPHLVKRFFWLSDSEFDQAKSTIKNNTKTYAINDPRFFAMFDEKGFTTSSPGGKTVQMYHLKGAHSPYVMNENGQKVPDATQEQQVAGCFNQILKMLANLKAQNLYDNACILILADHGSINMGAHPVCLIKEAGASGRYQTSEAPVSFFDLPPFLASLAGGTLDNQYSEDLRSLQENTLRERHLFYNTSKKSRVVINEYMTTGHAGDKASWKEINQYEELNSDKIEYELGTELSFALEATGNRYAYEGFGGNAGWRTALYGPLSELRIPIGNLPSDGELLVTFTISNRKNDYGKEFSVEANNQTVYQGSVDQDIIHNGLSFSVPVSSFQANNHELTIRFLFPNIDKSELQQKNVESRTYSISLVSMRIDVP